MSFTVEEVLHDTAGVDHVYVIAWSNIVKIGYTNNVLQRFSTIHGEYTERKYMQQTTTTPRLSLLAYVQGDKDLEKFLHTKFEENNVPRELGIGREWFYINDGILDVVKIMKYCKSKGIAGRNVALAINHIENEKQVYSGLYAI